MERDQGNSPVQSGASKPNILERVQTMQVNDASVRPSRIDSPSPRPARVARGPVAPDAVPDRTSTLSAGWGDDRQAVTSGADARWPLTLLALLVAGIVIGALVGAVVAVIAFP